ncbi:hypothetical protein WAI453_009551 [Rhynchosporium graminicola]
MSSAPKNETKRSRGELEDMIDFPDISSPTSAAAGEYTLPHRLRSGMTETTTSSGANAVFNETVQPVESQQNPASSLQLLPHRPKIVTTDEASHTLPDGQVKREFLDDKSVSTENLRDEHEINQREVIGRHALKLQQRRARGKPAPIPSNYDILLQEELPTPEHEAISRCQISKHF